MNRNYSIVFFVAIAFTFGTQQLEAQTQKDGQAVTSLSHNISPGPFSPFFTQATNSDGATVNYGAAGGLVGDLAAGAGDTTNVSGTITIVGNANAIANFNDGNGLPRGITLTYDLSFSISTTDGDLVTAGGNTGNGLGVGSLPFGTFDSGESIVFSAATVSNVAFTGTPEAGVTFTPGTVTGVGLSQFRSADFTEASEGAILDNGTDTIGFGVSTGTIASAVRMDNGFSAGNRFSAMLMDVPITLTNDGATGGFNLKGIEFTTLFDYEVVSPFDGVSVAVTNFSHNINPGPFSPFFTETTDSNNGTVYDFTDDNGLAGSIVSGTTDTTTVSGTIEIVGTATAAGDFLDGNQLPEGVTLSYDLSFTVSSPNGMLGTADGNTGNGIGIGPTQYEGIDAGEQLVFSAATISNVAFTGMPIDGSAFSPGNVTDVALDAFRAGNFNEANSGAVLSNGTDSVGFGLSTGSLASNVNMDNNFASTNRFPLMSMMVPTTLTADPGASFNLKGFELATTFTYDLGVVKGDVDLSGTVDFLDIGPFIMVLSTGGFQPEADVDCSTAVDFLDIGPFISILSAQ